MKNTDHSWWGLALGCATLFSSIFGLVYLGEGYTWRGGFVSRWTLWLLLPAGALITVLSILSIWRGEAKPKPYTDEEIAQAEADLDALYLRETGELPKKPEKEQ